MINLWKIHEGTMVNSWKIHEGSMKIPWKIPQIFTEDPWKSYVVSWRDVRLIHGKSSWAPRWICGKIHRSCIAAIPLRPKKAVTVFVVLSFERCYLYYYKPLARLRFATGWTWYQLQSNLEMRRSHFGSESFGGKKIIPTLTERWSYAPLASQYVDVSILSGQLCRHDAREELS